MLLRILTLASLLALAAPAAGAQLAIEGDWGDASGCGWNMSPRKNMRVTPRATSCAIRGASAKQGDSGSEAIGRD